MVVDEAEAKLRVIEKTEQLVDHIKLSNMLLGSILEDIVKLNDINMATLKELVGDLDV